MNRVFSQKSIDQYALSDSTINWIMQHFLNDLTIPDILKQVFMEVIKYAHVSLEGGRKLDGNLMQTSIVV